MQRNNNKSDLPKDAMMCSFLVAMTTRGEGGGRHLDFWASKFTAESSLERRKGNEFASDNGMQSTYQTRDHIISLITLKMSKMKIAKFENSVDPDEAAHHELLHLVLQYFNSQSVSAWSKYFFFQIWQT